MEQYLKLIKKILNKGSLKYDRTGVGTISIFGYKMIFNLQKGFPLITTKKCNFRSVIYELLWFLTGNTNVKKLNKKNIHIWDNWADKNGNLGPIYGKQWRKWINNNGEQIDQIKNIIKELKTNKDSRRLIVSTWNVGELKEMSLQPCHILFQLYVNKKKLSCQLYQRSCDVFLGLPFNIASYALLIHMFAQQTDLIVDKLIWIGGDTHIYLNHINQIKLQIQRNPKKLPKLEIIRKPFSIFKYKYKDFKIKNYNPYPAIYAKIAI
ncbi:thymidylate synthase [Candidatus Purcelliella pentastirinorum]|uniref:thymidylate synthase n=1 Tax=Candidatus Purcelliella pentastirinorum TaxID=472834 RepID=UPI002367D594|nr:thymidylate synthase [Candidatus Purcelliella pentastirinorum]WDI78813.1 thymidylate synthase [Candidatus Purcelliella pentastirinorum]WDR79946.1 thymidylate synthase [Candidatus Purcelliella pentastirinorum]